MGAGEADGGNFATLTLKDIIRAAINLFAILLNTVIQQEILLLKVATLRVSGQLYHTHGEIYLKDLALKSHFNSEGSIMPDELHNAIEYLQHH